MIIRNLKSGIAGYIVMIILGIFLPLLAVLGCLIIAVYRIMRLQTESRLLANGSALPGEVRVRRPSGFLGM